MNALHKEWYDLINQAETQGQTQWEQDPWRLQFHLMPPVGWLNDPNGLCWYNGEYHVFFQYSPFQSEGGLKFWGHYTSRDLLHWDYQGVPLCPDQPYDCHGVYSGSALAEEEQMTLFYTGNVKQMGNYDYINNGRESNTVMAVSKDGIHIHEKKLLMTAEDYPDHLTCHIRDPKVWKESDTYYMVQGARSKEEKGEVLLFTSSDKVKWTLSNILTTPDPFGYMWECPDLFVLNGQTYLSVSPQGLKPSGIQFQNLYQSGYFKLDGDYKKQDTNNQNTSNEDISNQNTSNQFKRNQEKNYKLSEFTEYDYGFDFYAPQTFQDNKGRRILIAWMGLPDIEYQYTNPTTATGWQHALTIPRILTNKNGHLCQNPPEEWEQLRSDHNAFVIPPQTTENITIPLPTVFDLELNNIQAPHTFTILLNDQIRLTHDAHSQMITLEFTGTSGCGRTKRQASAAAIHNIRMIGDTSSLEIFINNGETVFTTRFYEKSSKRNLQILGSNVAAKGSCWAMKKESDWQVG